MKQGLDFFKAHSCSQMSSIVESGACALTSENLQFCYQRLEGLSCTELVPGISGAILHDDSIMMGSKTANVNTNTAIGRPHTALHFLAKQHDEGELGTTICLWKCKVNPEGAC